MTHHIYGGGPRPLQAADPREGATIGELAEWIAYLRADGAPDDAPVRVMTNMRAGLKRAEILTGQKLAASLERRAERRAGTGGRPTGDDPPVP